MVMLVVVGLNVCGASPKWRQGPYEVVGTAYPSPEYGVGCPGGRGISPAEWYNGMAILYCIKPEFSNTRPHRRKCTSRFYLE